jgi:glycosyltransferase involved in cell wall biosynthesis
MKLSIVVPTYNRGELLREAINSITRTLRCEYEILICDDGSTDHTREVCDEFANAGTHVIFCGSSRNVGAQVARNRGLARSSGDCILFMDSDDIMAGEGVDRLICQLRADPSLGYVFGKVIRTDYELRPLPDRKPVGSDFPRLPREVAGYHWHTMGAVYRREALAEVGEWNVELTGSQDWEFQARVKLFGGKGEFVDTVVGYWRQHDGERVGAKAFRPDYVRSIMASCRSILKKARQAGKSDLELERRIARVLIIHALEWGANDYARERAECLRQAAECVPADIAYQIPIRVLRALPVTFDGKLRQCLTRER